MLTIVVGLNTQMATKFWRMTQGIWSSPLGLCVWTPRLLLEMSISYLRKPCRTIENSFIEEISYFKCALGLISVLQWTVSDFPIHHLSNTCHQWPSLCRNCLWGYVLQTAVCVTMGISPLLSWLPAPSCNVLNSSDSVQPICSFTTCSAIVTWMHRSDY